FESILGVEEETLRHRLHALPDVHAERNVASDTFNISCAWLIHAIFNSRAIPDTLKHDAVISTLLVLQYKFITSRLFIHFRFQAEAAGKKIISVSSVLEHDGKEILRDRNKSLIVYSRYLNSIITDKNSFIREELLVVIEKIILTMPPKLFRQTLVWMSENYRT